MISIMKQAISYRGYAIVDILQPCVSFNKINTFAYYSKRVYQLDESYDATDKTAALEKAMEYGDKIPIGIIYNASQKTFHQKNAVLAKGEPLLDKKTETSVLQNLIKSLL